MLDQATALGQREGRENEGRPVPTQSLGTDLISEARPTVVSGLSQTQGPKRKERLGMEWSYRVLFVICWMTGESPGSSYTAGFGSSRVVVLEEVNIHEGYQQMDEGTEKSMFSFEERNWREAGQASGAGMSRLEVRIIFKF